MIKRFNLFGGPGIGKSRTAARLFANLKDSDYNVELIQEYVKGWAWDNRKPTGFDQVYLFGKQLHREEVPLRAGVDCIVTDSPLLLNCVYAYMYNPDIYRELLSLERHFTNQYNEFNVLLRRDTKYHPNGRFQTEKEAQEIDLLIKQLLIEWKIKFIELEVNELSPIIINLIAQKVENHLK